MRVSAFSAALMAVFFSSVGAQAQQGEGDAQEDGFYLRAGAGASFVGDWSQSHTYNPDTTFVTPPPTGQTVDNSEGLVGVFAIGFDYADGIRTELEYRYASSGVDSFMVIDPVSGPAPVTPINDDIEAHLIMTNFYFDFTNNSPLTPFIGGGVGGVFVTNESAQRDAALAYQGRAGVSLAMGGGFSADLEYIYLRTNKLVFGIDDDEFVPGGPVGPSISGARYKTSSVMMSLRKQF